MIPDAAPAAPQPDASHRGAGMKLTIDDVVICLALLLGFSTSLLMAIANQSWGTNFPASMIAFFAAVSVAALIYRFLGGSGEAQFRMGVLQITGSAAILFGATWFLGDRIKGDSTLLQTDAEYAPKLEEKQKALTRARAANADLRDRNSELEERITAISKGRNGDIIGQIRRMRPDDPVISTIRRMIANEDVPFQETLRQLPARVTLNDSMTATNVYRICLPVQIRLFDNLDTQKDRLRMRRNRPDGDARVVDMVRGGTIDDPRACAPTGDRSFDIQITCADAVRLFPDRIERCNGLKPVWQPGATTIRGEAVTLGALPPR